MKVIDYVKMKKLFDEEYKRTMQLIQDGETHLDNLAEGFLEADRVIARLPDVDAVPVVRCKDCKHFEFAHDCNFHAADENGTPIFIREDDFCSYGERKG